MPRITTLDPAGAEVRGFEAKMLFHENRRSEARPVIDKLIQAGSADSALYYLAALIAADEGRRPDAVGLLEHLSVVVARQPLNDRIDRVGRGDVVAGPDGFEVIGDLSDLELIH
jgi:hypothetical protein